MKGKVYLLAACAALLTVISLQSPVLVLCLLLSGLMAISIQVTGHYLHIPKRYILWCQILVIGLVCSGFWLDNFIEPAQAQFFQRAEDFFTNNLTQGTANGGNTSTAVKLVFNVLRAIYLLYIAVALIGVINAVRKDEDWQSVAITPLLVVIAVTVADVITGFVIGKQ